VSRALLLACALLAACEGPTEVMLIVKAAPGLTFGPGADIDTLHVQAQPAGDDPLDFYFTKLVSLCAPADRGTADCRPQQFVDDSYDGALTLPVRLLMVPGDHGLDEEIRVWVDALKSGYAQPRIANGMRFRFSRGKRLWLELPLYHQCLDDVACEAQDQVCDKNRDCTSVAPTDSEPGADDASDAGDPTPPPDLAHACGASGQPCCEEVDPPCTGALACQNDYCIDPTAPCGQFGQACCGAPAAPCIGNGICDTDSETCQPPCGAIDQACCATGTDCLAGQCFKGDPVAGQNTCRECGGPGDRCCPGATCSEPGKLTCDSNDPLVYPSPTSVCVACGTNGGPCCADPSETTPCGAGLACNAQKCVTCGGGGDPCCAGGGCNSGLTCNGAMPPICAACGGSGQPCCRVGPACTCGGTDVGAASIGMSFVPASFAPEFVICQ